MPISLVEGTMDTKGSPLVSSKKYHRKRSYEQENGKGESPRARRASAAGSPAPMKRERFLVDNSLDDLSTFHQQTTSLGAQESAAKVEVAPAPVPAPAPVTERRSKLSRQASASASTAALSMLSTFSPRAMVKGRNDREKDRSLQSPRRRADSTGTMGSPRSMGRGKLQYALSDKLNKDKSPRGKQKEADAFTKESAEVEKRRLLMNHYKDLKKKEDKRNQLHNADKNLKDILAPDQMLLMVNAIPNYSLTVLESDMFLATVAGPNFDEGARVYKETVCARSISTYPHLDGLGRAGDPICDFYYLRLFEDAIIFSLADGCNWGEAPKQAAKRAGTSLVRYLQDRLHLLKNTQRAGKFILRAVSSAHAAIIEGYDDIWRVGTATLLGGVLMPLAPGQAAVPDSDTDISSPESTPESPNTGGGTDRDRDIHLGTFPAMSSPDQLNAAGAAFEAPPLPPDPVGRPRSRLGMTDGAVREQDPEDREEGREESVASPRSPGQQEGAPPPLPPDNTRHCAVVRHDSCQSEKTEEKTGTEKTETDNEEMESEAVEPMEAVEAMEATETAEERERKKKRRQKKKKKKKKKEKKERREKREREAAAQAGDTAWVPRPSRSEPNKAERKKRRRSRKMEKVTKKETPEGVQVPPIGLATRKWAFIFANVGDCKAFVYSPATRTARDITRQNRAASSSARDCGGRLGPYKEESGEPDLRNLDLRCELIDEGDIIIAVSDGVHDNLDPSMLGWTPSELQLNGSTWDEIPAEAAEAAKTKFREQRLANLLHTAGTPDEHTGHVPLVEMCNSLVEYCMATTEKSRQFMQKHPALELPEDYTLYPGKMDHTTCVCVKVGSASSELIRDAQQKRERLQSVR